MGTQRGNAGGRERLEAVHGFMPHETAFAKAQALRE